MKRSKTFTVTLSIVTLVAAGVFIFTLVHALWWAPEIDTFLPVGATSTPAANVPTAKKPDRFAIPAIGVDANVQYTGVNAKGNMGVPTNFTDVAWYKFGVVPGYVGTAVIDGHVDNGLGLAGVFKHLGDVKVGDDVYVTTMDGTKLYFVVDEIETYPYKSVPLDRVFNRADTARLAIITCEGNWVKNEKTYDERLVVYARLVSS